MSAIYQFKWCVRCSRATQFDIHQHYLVCQLCGERDRRDRLRVRPVKFGLAMIVGVVVIFLACMKLAFGFEEGSPGDVESFSPAPAALYSVPLLLSRLGLWRPRFPEFTWEAGWYSALFVTLTLVAVFVGLRLTNPVGD